MFRKLINRFVRPKHYWRDLGFDELSELYTSMMFRSLAMSLVGIFIPIYLYNLGYEVWQIFSFYTVFFSFWAICHYPVAQLIARVGPKHSILASYVLQVVWLLMMVSLKDLHWPLLLIAAVIGISNCLFFLAFHVDFSKIKHSNDGGKEVGWMYSMEKSGAVLGPIAGGIVAYAFGSQYIFLTAIFLLLVGLIPLFLTQEPTATNQTLRFKDLKVKEIKYDLLSYGFLQLENMISVTLWPMFISIYVFRDNPYLQLGSIMSVSVLLAIFIARNFGKTIDRKQGRSLLRTGAILNASLHLFRPFTNGFPFAMGVSMANEIVTPSYRMPYTKGMYDAADDLPGKRIVYITAMEVTGAIAKLAPFPALTALALTVQEPKHLFYGIFVIAALASLGVMFEHFRALKVANS